MHFKESESLRAYGAKWEIVKRWAQILFIVATLLTLIYLSREMGLQALFSLTSFEEKKKAFWILLNEKWIGLFLLATLIAGFIATKRITSARWEFCFPLGPRLRSLLKLS